jgi:seryl-tRNA(Sec) selenium transferase
LPDVTGMKFEVLVQKAHRSGWEHQIVVTGAKMVEVETVEDVKRALSERTAAMHFLNYNDPDGKIKRAEWLALAHAAGVPAFLDAAADTPPKANLSEYARMGFDLISFSGGKAMRGPQCAGLLIGRADRVHNALLNMSPNEGTIGRATKVGKEEIVGMVKAVELFLAEDQAGVTRMQMEKLGVVATAVKKFPGVTVTYDVPPIANNFPEMKVMLDPKKFSVTADVINKNLAAMRPSIVLAGGGNVIQMTAINFQAGEERIIADALSAQLKAAAV